MMNHWVKERAADRPGQRAGHQILQEHDAPVSCRYIIGQRYCTKMQHIHC